MSVVHLPPAEPPDDPTVTRLLEQLGRALHHQDIAGERLMKVTRWSADRHLDDLERMHLRVMLAVRERECELWAAEIRALKERLRARGLELD